MADSTTPPPRPLNNRELIWRSTFQFLGELHRSGYRNEALDLAWECYQDPAIPRKLRTACCMLLGTASEGDYVTFAREGFEQAKSMLDDYLDNARLQNILIEAQNVLDSAEKNAEADYKKAVAEADRTGAAAAASAVDTSFTFSSAASSAVSAAYTEKLEVDKDVPDDHDSEQLKGN